MSLSLVLLVNIISAIPTLNVGVYLAFSVYPRD